MNTFSKKITISVIGLGYVGLPLAVEFAKKFNLIGYDINKERINNLKKNIDYNGEIPKSSLYKLQKILFTNNIKDLKQCNVHIIAVPTPIKRNYLPDLRSIKHACLKVSEILKRGDTIIFESTVYPGLTEEYCVPLIEKGSKLIFNKDFFCGYSPERINPGDKIKTITKITKITSGSNKQTSIFVDKLYQTIIKAGTYMAPSIKVAEAAKVIENAQRDINIAFVNELAIIFDKLNIDTNEVLKAASTKWNFLNFKPGLVGGHCIGVDPYYLSYKSKSKGYNPKFISSGRTINDNFHKHVGDKFLIHLKNKFKNKKLKVLLLGATFKENCPDYRNSKSLSLYKYLKTKNIEVKIYDPLINSKEFSKKNKIKLLKNLKGYKYHGIILVVAHKYFLKIGLIKLRKLLIRDGVFFDFKNAFNNSSKNLTL
jgi:UDP-N-acetyl-D-glucosamine/UDP-N-acetyl-D-galactosamine dehydrogenase